MNKTLYFFVEAFVSGGSILDFSGGPPPEY